MRARRFSKVLLCVLLAGWALSGYCDAQTLAPSTRRLLKQGVTLYVATKSAEIHSASSAESPVVGRLEWSGGVRIDPAKVDAAPAGWLPVKGSQGEADGWIRQSDLVIGDQMRKVVACWPIKKIKISVGDWAGEFSFKPDGSGNIDAETTVEPYSAARARRVSRIHVYMEKGLVEIVRLSSRKNDVMGKLMLHPETGRAFTDGSPMDEQVNFSLSELQGCTAPVVSEKPVRGIRFLPDRW